MKAKKIMVTGGAGLKIPVLLQVDGEGQRQKKTDGLSDTVP